MEPDQTIELPVRGMDCVECTQHVAKALNGLPGISAVQVYLAAEKAVFQADPKVVSLQAIHTAVKEAGYEVPEDAQVRGLGLGPVQQQASAAAPGRLAALEGFTRPILTLFGILFCAILFIVVVGEWLGLFEKVTERVPWPVGLVLVLVSYSAPLMWGEESQ